MRIRQFFPFLLLLFVVSLTATRGWSQASTGMLSGTIQDPSGAVIPGATISLSNQETNESAKSETNSAGYYVFLGLVPGPYLLIVEAPGMQKFEGSLTVQVQQSAVVDVSMKVGATNATVSVQGVTPLVSVDNGTLGGTLEHSRIEQLPLNGRQVMTLLQVVPGMEGTRAFGIRDGSEDVSVDGATIMDRTGWNTVNPRQPGLDSIQEFAVVDNGSSAKYARPTTVVMSTKSGTNQLHGSAFETNRNNAIGLARSRTDYYTKPPFLNRNEFGVSGGGPVYIPKVYNGRNKTFWFFSYEALRLIQNTSQGFPSPTAAMRNGDMSGIADANGIHSTIYDPYSTNTSTWARVPFPNNQIPNTMESPIAKYLLDVMPLPTLSNVNPNVAANWFGAVPSFQRSWTLSARGDQRVGDNDVFYFRYSQGNYSTRSQFYSQPTTDWNKVPSGTQGYIAPNRNEAVSWVHNFSPTLFNEVLASGSYGPWFVGTGDLTHNYDAELGLPNPFGVGGWPGIYQAGMESVGNGFEWETQNTNAANSFYLILDDNATKVLGRHEFQFGFHYRYDQLDILPAQQQVAGNDNFATGATALYDPSSGRTSPQALPYTGDDFANFYLGVANYSNQYVRGMFYARAKEYAGYFQDKYKVSPRLTLNLGLRYEFWPAFRAKNNAVVSFDPANQAIVLGASLQQLEATGYTTPSIVAREQQLGVKFETYQQAGMPQTLETGNKLDFAPRLGVAYRLTAGPRPLVLRSGYALSYFHIPLNPWSQRMRLNAPMNARFITSVTQAAYSPDGIGNYGLRSAPTVIAGKNSTNAVTTDTVGSLSAGSAVVDYFALNQPDPRVHNWNFTIEKEIFADTLVRASYIGNHSYALEQVNQFNLSTPAYIWYLTTGTALPTGSLAAVATNAFNQTTYGSLENWQNTGWGNSNGISVEMQRRFSKGYAYQFFYVLDNNFAAGGQGYGGTSVIPSRNQFLPGSTPSDPSQFDRLYDYQRDTSTPKHRFRWNWLADLPVGKGKPLLGNSGRLLNSFIGNWQIAGIGSANSTYFTLPAADFPTGTPVEVYGYKYPIQNCTSGTCYPGYLFWNGYIPSNLINSQNAAGKPNGYEGIPSNYQSSVAPLIVYGQNSAANAPAGTNFTGFYNTNTVWVPISNGTVQRTTWSGLAPLRQQYFPGIWQWNLDASLFKNIPIGERFRFRLQADFFNVLNHPGNTNSFIGATGILNVQSSGVSPRTLQLSGRLNW
jgi:hypothetical protein